ncbi:hypothetical protein GPZ88_00810 [Streptococcus ruminicola]|uniref:Uncharacterized protein n=1 Tax=Streptococcus ruminicola TaxID=2686210 RepID=A0A6G8HY28_9STRE|nr:hypothetical protein [Streptococcus ruminicola]QIM45681.1 hypothetical protein GPZ88_00810 [Streptococcus ruminicola]
METKMCKPVKDIDFVNIADKVKEYTKLEELLEASCINELDLFSTNIDGYAVKFVCKDDELKDAIQGILERRLEILEGELNVLGYTMEDEPKEIEVHVNYLKGGSDE